MPVIVALNHPVVNGPKIRADIQTPGGFLYGGGRSGCHAESRTVTSPSPAEGGLKPASITAETLATAHLSPDTQADRWKTTQKSESSSNTKRNGSGNPETLQCAVSRLKK